MYIHYENKDSTDRIRALGFMLSMLFVSVSCFYLNRQAIPTF